MHVIRRKKSRVADLESLDHIVVEGVKLKEEFLLTCSLADYEKVIERLSIGRTLSSNEERAVIAQRRRVKNRESAQESRDKQKMQVNGLAHELDGLRNANQNLSAENDALRADVQRLEKMLSMHDSTFLCFLSHVLAVCVCMCVFFLFISFVFFALVVVVCVRVLCMCVLCLYVFKGSLCNMTSICLQCL